MHLLVTNDDGIDSVFLRELVRALRAAGHVTAVVAPKREQSWIGAAKSRHRPVSSETADRGLGCPTWIVDGTDRWTYTGPGVPSTPMYVVMSLAVGGDAGTPDPAAFPATMLVDSVKVTT